jgi:pimeloyl-ACP methyl ester carboxylesterase
LPGTFASANDLEIYYRDYGKGHPLILLHGGTDTHRLWDPFIPDLIQHFRVITPDSRGHGRTTNPAGGLSYRMMADDLARFIEVLKLEKPFVFGYSDGGQATLDFGMRYPNLAGALVIGGVWYRFSQQYQDALRKAGFEGPGQMNYEIIGRDAGPGWMDRVRETHPNPDPAYYRTLLKQISEMWWTPLNYSEEDFRKITVPTLILVGEKDEMVPLEEAQELADLIPNAELFIINRTSHNEVLQEGGSFLNIVLGFLLKFNE